MGASDILIPPALEQGLTRRSAEWVPAVAAAEICLQGDDLAAFSALVAEIYDAAVDPTRWTAVLGKVRGFVGGTAAVIFSKDATNKNLNVYYDCGGTDPSYQRFYAEKYGQFDPFTTAHVLADLEQPICAADLMPQEEFQKTRFYREWVQPQGLVDFVTAVLDRSTTGAALCGSFAASTTAWRTRTLAGACGRWCRTSAARW
jgi:hypothetical protein